MITYSHSQRLFYEFVSKITNKLVKQSLRVTVSCLLKNLKEPKIVFEKCFLFSLQFFCLKSLSGTLGLELRARAGFGLCGLKKFWLGHLRACQKVLRAGRAFGLGLP